MAKHLIINADDFGMSVVFNDVILDLIEKDLVRSTSVMVDRITDNQKDQVNKLVLLAQNKPISVGLHIEFLSDDYQQEINEQFQKFKDLFCFNPSHIDIHKANIFTDSFPYVADFCIKMNIPTRNIGIPYGGVKATATEAFFGSINDFSKIEAWIKTLQDGKYYEILFHPGKYDPKCTSSLNRDREIDVENIKKLNSIIKINNIKIISYFDL